MSATNRVHADGREGAVLFLIGMRLNRPWKVHRWGPVFMAMPRMLRELGQHPDLGLLHARTYISPPNVMVLQYWASQAQLLAFARDPSHSHLPAWRAYNRAVGASGDVGIWHETYDVSAKGIESVYSHMPPYGLGAARGHGRAPGPTRGPDS